MEIWKKLAGLAASNQVALGRSGRILSKDWRCETQRRSVAPSGMIRQRGRGVKRWDTPLLTPGYLRRLGGSCWEVRTAFLRSLPPECPSEGAKCETLGRSVTRSGMMRRRGGRNRRSGLESWKKLAGLAASNQVVMGRSGYVLSKDLKCETQRHSVAPSGMIRQRGRGLKRWDAPLLAPG